MRSIRHFRTGFGLACLLTAGLAGQVLGASRVAYTVELGGDNFAAQWKAGTRVAYARGNPADGQVFYKADLLNYAIVLEASGIHSQAGHASDNKEIYGAANAVFNLEFLNANDQVVNDVIFRSTINDGTGTDPFQPTTFALGFTRFGTPGRLIDNTTVGGPRLEPIFTYPHAPSGSGTWVGMGAGYKEWVRTGASNLITMPGVGMVDVPPAYVGGPRRAGMGIVPVAEGQIDVSNLADGIYKLRVTPGNGNNVLRGDFDMVAATNRPAFAVAANETAPDTITFTVNNIPQCTSPGIKGRHILYNNSKWDNNGSTINKDVDWAAIAPNKQPLLPGAGQAVPANWITYSKSINCIVVDACHFNRVPVVGQDLLFVMGNNLNDPFTWSEAPVDPTVQLFPGEGDGGSDRLVITWPDNTIPNTRWLLTGIFAGDLTLGIPADDFFIFGVAVGDASGNLIVNAEDEVLSRPPYLHNAFNPAPIDDQGDHNRDKLVNANDEVLCRPPYVTNAFNSLKRISW